MPQTDEQLQGPAATTSPWSADVDPWTIANDPTLDRATKLERLHQLEMDVRLVENALEEGMTGNTRLPPLGVVLAALERVGGDDPEAAAQESQTKI
jgi:hypothetical protein